MDYNDEMTKTRRKAIYSFAESIRAGLQLKTPVDLELIVNQLRGKIAEETLDEDISGKIEKNEEHFTITLNNNHSQSRKNFTIAHELGHLFLHMGYMIDKDKWNSIDKYIDSPYYRIGHSEEEYEANQFAGALLMPQDEYKNFVDNNKDSDNSIVVSKISEHFNVSDDAALTRGKWLGIFEWD